MHADRNRQELIAEVARQLRAFGTDDHVMNQATAARLGLHPTDMHAGEVLDRLGPMTIGDLARAVGVSPGAATALIDRLEHAGMARRVPDAANRRRILVEPTPDGRRRSMTVFGGLIQSATQLLDRYQDEELELFVDLIRGLRQLLSDHTEAVRSGE